MEHDPSSGRPGHQDRPDPSTPETSETPETTASKASETSQTGVGPHGLDDAPGFKTLRWPVLLISAAIAGAVFGVLFFAFMGGFSPEECVDSGLSVVACEEPTAYAKLAAEAEVTEDDAVTVSLEACPDTTAEVAASDDTLLCLSTVDGDSWISFDPPEPGDCVLLPAGRLALPSQVSCDIFDGTDPGSVEGVDAGAEHALVVSSLRLSPASGSEDSSMLDIYHRTVEGKCEVGSPVGPSFFEWRAGASEMLCILING